MNIKKLLLFVSFLIQAQEQYQHSLYFITNNNAFAVSDEVQTAAFNLNKDLGLSKYYDTTKLMDCAWVQQEFAKDSTHSERQAKTEDNVDITYSYFNRNADTLLVIGPGFTNAKEKMAPFVHMFTNYDIAIVNFRGHGYSNSIRISPLYNMLGIDSSVQLGAHEEKDIIAVTTQLKKTKKYKTVIGLGICFGAFIVAKAESVHMQQHQMPLFDKIILDGCWLSLNKFAEKITNDPYLIINPQTGGASNWVRSLFKRKAISNCLQCCIEKGLNIQFAQVDILDHLKHIHIPTLLFYGKDDLTITRHEFEEIWQGLASTKKAAIITSNPHVHNHLKSKEMYKLATELFIEQDIAQCAACLQNNLALERHIIEAVKNRIKQTPNDTLKPKKMITPKSNRKLYITLATLSVLAGGIWYFMRRTN